MSDRLYVVEHKRDGEWRIHLDMNISTIEAYCILEMQKLRRQFPNSEWRVAPYEKAMGAATPEAEELLCAQCGGSLKAKCIAGGLLADGEGVCSSECYDKFTESGGAAPAQPR